MLISGPNDFQAAFDVSRETVSKLEVYADLLRQWQRTINLVAPKTVDDVWHRHFADSAQVFRHIPSTAAHVMDLGSGGGFPGLVLAILAVDLGPKLGLQQGLRVTLVESDTRKAAFMREVARKTGIAVDIMPSRIETIVKSANVAPIDVFTSRALAPLIKLLELVQPLFQPHSVALFLKGRSADAELQETVAAWDFFSELVPSLTEDKASLVVVRDLKPKKGGVIP